MAIGCSAEGGRRDLGVDTARLIVMISAQVGVIVCGAWLVLHVMASKLAEIIGFL